MSDIAVRRAELADVVRMLELANDSVAVASANFATETRELPAPPQPGLGLGSS